MYEVDFSQLGKLLNKWIKNIWNNRSRYIICKGGGGSGKSYGVAQLIVYRMIAEEGHKILVVRKVANTLRESCFSLIREVISLYGCNDLFKINKSDMTIECINGNKMIFRGLDDPEKIKSINGITDIWIEEASELLVGDYRQLNIRLRGKTRHPKQFYITFNPISVTHWLKAEFFDNRKADSTIIETTYKNNRFLDAEAVKVLEDFKITDEYYYTVYCLGEWGVIGRTIFPAKIVTERIVYLKGLNRNLKRGYFTFDYEYDRIIDSSIKWVDDPDGYITIYHEVIPKVPYVISGDTSGEGSDFFSGHVLNNITGEQCAVLHHQFDEDLYTRQMYCLGKMYNYALLSIEANFSTFPNKELMRFEYSYLYTREVQDSFTGKLEKRYGFRTDKITRPMMVANLVKIVREHIELFNDIPTLEEMLTFVRSETGKAEAQEGSRDDLILGVCIGHVSRHQQRMYMIEQEEAKPKKLADTLGIKKNTR